MKLKKLEVNAFAGISPTSPVVIDFTRSKVVRVTSDEHRGKTSLLNALLVACGQLSKDNKDFVNLETGKEDINFSFVGKDRLSYEVRITKSAFILKYEGEALPEPISKIKELLGIVGVSPMDIKNKPLKEIVKWLSSYSSKSAEEYEDLIQKYKDGIKKAAESRATANKAFKATDEYLNGEEMFLNWEKSEKKYVTKPDIKALSAEMETARDKSDNLSRGQQKLIQHNARKAEIEQQIAALNKELGEVNSKITIGESYVEENKFATQEYNLVKEKYDNVVQETLDFNKWESIKEKKTERDEFETAAQRADANEKSLKQELKELQAEILPDIKGVELILEDTHVDGVIKKEGLYWDDRNVRMLSESEWWSVVLSIWRKFKVKIVVIDNAQSLGSNAIEILNKLAKDGAYILCAEMNREIKELTINYQ